MSTATAFRYSLPYEDHFEKLIESSHKKSFDPEKEIDWAAPLDPNKHGLSPEWCSLYGTEMWNSLTEEQKVTLTRHEVCSILSTGVWIENLLQVMLLRAHYNTDHCDPEFRFALVEIADECRHSIMFSKGCEKIGGHYKPKKLYHELGRLARIVSTPELSFAAILAGEELLDIMQRDWMRDERVLDEVRIGSRIHSIEEARHMKFARIELRQQLENMNPIRKRLSAYITALAVTVLFDALVHPDVYKSVGLDPEEAKKVAWKNPHRREMFKLGNERLMSFFQDIGFMTPEAKSFYKKVSAI